MKTVFWWGSVVLVCICMLPSAVHAQNLLDRDSWNVAAGDWGDDDNWVDDLDELSGVPTTQDDRWALVDGGVATVTGDHSTSGLTIGNSGTVDRCQRRGFGNRAGE